MITKLNEHYSMTNPASIYDEESLTSLELAGRTAKKVNECVEHVNAQDEDIKHQKEVAIPETIKNEVQKQIDNGTFDSAIDQYAGELESRVDNLLGSVTQGSTTMDAEIIDARVGADNTTYTNLGGAIRGQFLKTLMLKTATVKDANQITEAGVYFRPTGEEFVNLPEDKPGSLIVLNGGNDYRKTQIFVAMSTNGFYIRYFNGSNFTAWKNLDTTDIVSNLNKNSLTRNETPQSYNANTLNHYGVVIVRTSDVWENLPESNPQSGMFLNMNDSYNYNSYQIYFTYSGQVYLRHKIANTETFSPWVDISTSNKGGLPVGTDLNTLNVDGFYFIAGSSEYLNLPEDNVGGLLEVKYQNDYRWYQTYISASSGGYYFRNYNSGWQPWKRLALVSDIPPIVSGSTNKEYTIQKKDATSCYIFKRGTKGLIRYEYGMHTDDSMNLNVWRLRTISYCNFNGAQINSISEIGADLEGVILLDGDSDHIGGVHGDEQMTESLLFIGGKQYSFNDIKTMEADEIQVIVKSTIYHMDSNTPCFTKCKRTVFDRDGVHVHMEWTPLEVVNIDSIRACMMSVNKAVITHVFDSNIEKYPITFPSDEGDHVIADQTLDDAYYIGEVSIHHWAGERGGDTNKMTGFVGNYGYRLKSYFTCYDNHTTVVGEKLTATNNFYITC